MAAAVMRSPTRSPGFSPKTPLPIENDPRAVFERLFGTSGSTNAAARMDRMQRDRSILDLASSELKGLEKVLGPTDKSKVDEYFDSVRDIERRIQMAETQNTRELPVVDQPVGIPSDFAEHAQADGRIFLAMAYQTDAVEVPTRSCLPKRSALGPILKSECRIRIIRCRTIRMRRPSWSGCIK